MTKIKEFKIIQDYMDLGDGRLNKRSGKILHQISAQLDKSIPQACLSNKGAIKATYRFLDNDKVTMDNLIEGDLNTHQRSAKNVHKQVLLVAQDTTELDFTKKPCAKEFGPLNHKHQRGCKLHNSLMMNQKGIPLGMFKQSITNRKEEDFGKRNNRKREPIEDKETYRWLKHHNALQDYYEDYPKIEVFDICDREGDIMELFATNRRNNVHLIVRSKHNRVVIKDDGTTSKLKAELAKSPVQSTYRIEITNRATCKKRSAQVQLRWCEVTVKLGQPNKYQKHLQPQKLWVVQVTEINPPKGKKAVNWILLTTKEVTTIRQAKVIVRYYEHRWTIERLHFVLKSGAQIKDLMLQTKNRVLRAIAAYTISSVKIMKINYLARFYPDLQASKVGISQTYIKALYDFVQQNIDAKITFRKSNPPTIKQAVILIARLGGYTNFKNQKFPGLKTFWRGWSVFNIINKCKDTDFSKN